MRIRKPGGHCPRSRLLKTSRFFVSGVLRTVLYDLYDFYVHCENSLTEKNSSAYACASCCFTWPITTSLLGPLADPEDGEEKESMAVQLWKLMEKRKRQCWHVCSCGNSLKFTESS